MIFKYAIWNPSRWMHVSAFSSALVLQVLLILIHDTIIQTATPIDINSLRHTKHREVSGNNHEYSLT